MSVQFILTGANNWGSSVKTIQTGSGTSLGLPAFVDLQESTPGEFIRGDGYLFFAVRLSDTETVGTTGEIVNAENTFGRIVFKDNMETYSVSKVTLFNAGSFVYVQALVSHVIA